MRRASALAFEMAPIIRLHNYKQMKEDAHRQMQEDKKARDEDRKELVKLQREKDRKKELWKNASMRPAFSSYGPKP